MKSLKLDGKTAFKLPFYRAVSCLLIEAITHTDSCEWGEALGRR